MPTATAPAPSRNGTAKTKPEVDIDAIAERIKDREHQKAKDILEHARQQGEDLLAIKKQFGLRKFDPWCKQHRTELGIRRTTCHAYVKIAEGWERICSECEQMPTTVSARSGSSTRRRRRLRRNLNPMTDRSNRRTGQARSSWIASRRVRRSW